MNLSEQMVKDDHIVLSDGGLSYRPETLHLADLLGDGTSRCLQLEADTDVAIGEHGPNGRIQEDLPGRVTFTTGPLDADALDVLAGWIHQTAARIRTEGAS